MRTIVRPADLPQYVPGEIWLDKVHGVACYFGRLFLNSLGVAPHRYLLQRRLDRARNLLRISRHSIAEIASATGFSDQSHMTRHFKRRFGVTPQNCRTTDRGCVSGPSQYALANGRTDPS